jgi:hypothetical protein
MRGSMDMGMGMGMRGSPPVDEAEFRHQAPFRIGEFGAHAGHDEPDFVDGVVLIEGYFLVFAFGFFEGVSGVFSLSFFFLLLLDFSGREGGRCCCRRGAGGDPLTRTRVSGARVKAGMHESMCSS